MDVHSRIPERKAADRTSVSRTPSSTDCGTSQAHSITKASLDSVLLVHEAAPACTLVTIPAAPAGICRSPNHTSSEGCHSDSSSSPKCSTESAGRNPSQREFAFLNGCKLDTRNFMPREDNVVRSACLTLERVAAPRGCAPRPCGARFPDPFAPAQTLNALRSSATLFGTAMSGSCLPSISSDT